MIPLDDTVCLATGKNLATVVTLMPDGQPQAPGPHGRVIPAIGADKINTPRLLGR